jgi:hypothetical protein
MYWRPVEIPLLGLPSKLGLHPLRKAVLVAISTSPPKWPPILGPYQLKIVEICNALVGLCFLYVLEIMWSALV